MGDSHNCLIDFLDCQPEAGGIRTSPPADEADLQAVTDVWLKLLSGMKEKP